jgi:precorrin-2/cobalt-factor-2 C20-methyltransferase
MVGKLYGIGVGPGDPELLTIKGLRIIKECDVIALPSKDKMTCTSYNIVKGVYEEIDKKETILLDYPMSKDKELLERCRIENENKITNLLIKGKNIAFLTLGDPTIYSTYIYLHKSMKEKGFDAEIISGVPSFCSIAASLSISLSEAEEEIHIIPATYGVSKTFDMSGTKILMKSGTKLKEIKQLVKEKNCYVAMAENCSMPNEKIVVGVDELEDSSGYYTTVIIKDSCQ